MVENIVCANDEDNAIRRAGNRFRQALKCAVGNVAAYTSINEGKAFILWSLFKLFDSIEYASCGGGAAAHAGDDFLLLALFFCISLHHRLLYLGLLESTSGVICAYGVLWSRTMAVAGIGYALPLSRAKASRNALV